MKITKSAAETLRKAPQSPRRSELTLPKPFAGRPEILAKLDVSDELLTRARRRFPVQWPAEYLALVGSDPHVDPIAKMGRPTEAEFQADPGDLADAIGDRLMRPMPYVVRKHSDRVIILTTKRCHFYCRFCFRREDPPSEKTELSAQEWDQVFHFLENEPLIDEVILSGGDPLTLKNEQLFWIKRRLLTIPHVSRWRIHTRAPVHFPHRVDQTLIQGLSGGLPLRWITHFNHFGELSSQTRRQAHLLARFNIPFLNQAVLLAGVNATLAQQLALWRGLSQMGIQAYYLHHPDRVQGNAHFRISLKRGLVLYRELCQKLGEDAPRYVLDLPDGRGKVPVKDLVHLENGRYSYTHADGFKSYYQDIPE